MSRGRVNGGSEIARGRGSSRFWRQATDYWRSAAVFSGIHHEGGRAMSKRGVLCVIAVNLLGTMPAPAREAVRSAEISTSQGSVERMNFGKTPEGTPVELYVLTNGKMTAKVMTYGAILTEL